MGINGTGGTPAWMRMNQRVAGAYLAARSGASNTRADKVNTDHTDIAEALPAHGAPETNAPADETAGSGSIIDKAVISGEGRDRLQKSREKLIETENYYKALLDQLAKANEQIEASGDGMKNRTKCLLIAMRIMAGDKVPQEDHKFLLENDMALYFRAITLRRQKEDPIDHDRLSEDESGEGPDGSAADAQKSISSESASGGESVGRESSGGESSAGESSGGES